MTLNTDKNTITAVGDGSTTEFSFPYLVYAASHLTITIDDVITTSWSAAVYGAAAGVTVTFTTAPDNGSDIVIQRIVPNIQDTDLENFDGNPANVTEEQFDLLVMADQQINEKTERSILTPIGTTLTSNAISGTIDTTTRLLTITTAGPSTGTLTSIGSSDLDTVLSSLADNDFLSYNLAGDYWENVDALIGSQIDINGADSGTIAASDEILFGDVTDSNNVKKDTAQGILDLIIGTGDAKFTLKTTADTGWVLMDDGTIGSAASGATNRANADTEDLYTLLWDNISDTYASVSGGRGASAAADFAADKSISLNKVLGRSLGVAGAGSGLTSRALGEIVGEETHQLITNEMPAHNHSTSGVSNSTGGTARVRTTDVAAATTVNTSSAGGDGAHNNIQPTSFWNVMIKL